MPGALDGARRIWSTPGSAAPVLWHGLGHGGEPGAGQDGDGSWDMASGTRHLAPTWAVPVPGHLILNCLSPPPRAPHPHCLSPPPPCGQGWGSISVPACPWSPGWLRAQQCRTLGNARALSPGRFGQEQEGRRCSRMALARAVPLALAHGGHAAACPGAPAPGTGGDAV